MKVAPKTILKDYEGQEILAEEKPVFLKTVLVNALSYREQGLEPTPEQAIRAYELGLQLMNKDEVELTSEDIVFIKQRLIKIYLPLIYGQVVRILEDQDET